METTNVLYLPLKKKWFEMIRCGIKKEEYRSITPYWIRRLTNANGTFKNFKIVEFTLGYPQKDDVNRRIRFTIKTIFKGCGLSDWGAEDGVHYYVIQLDKRLEL